VELEKLRWIRRAASAVVSLSAIALVMAKTSGPSEAGGDTVGGVASIGFCASFVALIIIWRKEHAANEAAFAIREQQQLASLRLQVELAKRRAAKSAEQDEKPQPTT
jgi:hypothetical protein